MATIPIHGKKLHVEPSVKGGGFKVCTNSHGPLRWPPFPYMVKTLKNLLLRKLWGRIWVYSIVDSRSTKFVQMMTVDLPLPFLRQGQICGPMYLYGENAEKPFSKNVLNTTG